MAHLTALLKKNYILWKRSCCCSLCEILLPLVFIAILLSIRFQVEIKQLDEQAFILESPQADVPRKLAPNMAAYHKTPDANIDRLLTELPQMKNCKNYTVKGQCYRNGLVALGPEGNRYAQTLATYFQDYYGYEVKWFKDNEAIDSYVRQQNYYRDPIKPLCLGVMFDSQRNFEYSLRFNTSIFTDDFELPSNEYPRIDPIKYEDQENSILYFRRGVLTIQNWVDNLFLQDFDPQARIEPTFSFVHRRKQQQDPFPQIMQGAFAVYIVLPIMIVYLRLTHSLIYEKEKKLREGMKMMGLSNWSFYAAWIIQYALIYGIICILGTAILKSAVFVNSSWGVLFLNYWLFCMVLLAQSLFLQVFFTNSLLGLIIAIVFFLLQQQVSNIVGQGTIPNERYWAASISSMAGLSYSYDVICQFEGQNQGVDFSNITTSVNNYYVLMAWIMHTINFFFYLLLAIYLDQVFPNEWGVKKHPLFFLPCFSEQKNRRVQIMRSSSRVGQAQDRFEDVELALKQQEDHHQALVISGLYKMYPNGKRAVSNLSLSMYQNQIFALLGHNGAGKTTTISMLTGLIEISEGAAMAFGLDVQTQMEELRTLMGVCPQHDILFDNLTVKEHLEMFATFKGMDRADIDQAVTRLIEDVDLVDKTDYLAKNLSGGQKRRLSVAIAFIGNSKLIYLDEPTSGMDTSARRFIWEMLKNYKQDRIIVLTTHFMDEADFLGDRIGIMGEGRLMCSGSSVFLKNQFGIGYNLTLVKQTTLVESKPIIDLVKSNIAEATVLSDVSAEISFQLPLGQISRFPALFDSLDARLRQLQVTNYGISITTLEEVFLKVAKIDVGHQQVQDIQNEDEKERQVDDFDLNMVRITNCFEIFFKHTKALMLKRLRIFRRDLMQLFCEVLLPIIIIIAGLGMLTIKFVKDDITVAVNPQGLYGKMQLQSYYGGDQGGNELIQFFDQDYWEFKYLDSGLATSDLKYFQEFDKTSSPGWYYFEQVSSNNLRYTFFANSVFIQSSVVLLNQMNQAILRRVSNNPTATITARLAPFPQTVQQLTIDDLISGYVGAFVFSIALAFIPASIISFIVKEREVNIKHQQLVSGVSVLAYWFSNWLLDIVKHVIPAVLSALMVLAFSISSMTEDGNYGAIWAFFFLYGWAIIPFSYLCSFMFKVPGSAMMVTFFLNLLVGSLLSIVVYILFTIESTRSAAEIIQWIFRPLPSFSFSYGLMRTTNKQFFAEIYEDTSNVDDTFALSVAGTDLLALLIAGVGYAVLVFVVEFFEDNGLMQKFSSESSVQKVQQPMDDDVENEANKCSKLNPRDASVLVRNLRKVYMLEDKKNKVAVDDISFSVTNGEVFGLLGVNGAGKTTTFKILSGELKPTSGAAYIANHSVVDQIESARKYIGYCPQFDALLENLSVSEHLALFAAIKGIPEAKQQDLIEKKMLEMDLKRFENVLAGQLSGGNKRKLSVAIAMIGNPPIVFLDEPSTGMDPEARRFMWNVISRIATQRKQSSIILTTHSMEEAEALSTKIAIQVDGNLKCFGSVQHVKNKFGKGYELEVKLRKPDHEDIMQMLKSMKLSPGQRINEYQAHQVLGEIGALSFMDLIKQRGVGSHLYHDLVKQQGLQADMLAEFVIVERRGQEVTSLISTILGKNEIIEHFQTFFRFKILADVSAGQLFRVFEENKEKMHISQYSIKQASIEQIFNQFAKQDGKQPDNNNREITAIQIEK